MRKNRNNFGFSLTEVLLALGTLSIGMIFVAGVFPVAIYFSTQATEQTIAAVVADEAFAKIRLYGINPDLLGSEQSTLLNSNITLMPIDPCEFAYPSDFTVDVLQRRYWWSALCRRLGDTRLVQVTVFISRKISASTTYPDPTDPLGKEVPYPMPVQVGVDLLVGNVLTIQADRKTFINDGYTIVDDENGQIYQVRERYPSPNDDTIELDRPWNPGLVSPDRVWVIPPPDGGGRYPCIAVYQKVIRF